MLFDGGEAAAGGFFVDGGEVVAGLLHDFDNAVEGDGVAAVGEGGVEVGVESAGGGVGVAFDARNLHEAADGVAGEAEVVFKTHFGGVFDLARGATEELRGGCGGHGAGHSDFALAADFGARDRGVVFDDVAEEAGRGEGAENALLREAFGGVEMVENGGEHAARAAGGCGYDFAAGGVFFADAEGVGVDQSARFERGVVARGMHVI